MVSTYKPISWGIVGEANRVGKTIYLSIEGKRYALTPSLDFGLQADLPDYRVWGVCSTTNASI